jgi:hypothetical protein
MNIEEIEWMPENVKMTQKVLGHPIHYCHLGSGTYKIDMFFRLSPKESKFTIN